MEPVANPGTDSDASTLAVGQRQAAFDFVVDHVGNLTLDFKFRNVAATSCFLQGGLSSNDTRPGASGVIAFASDSLQQFWATSTRGPDASYVWVNGVVGERPAQLEKGAWWASGGFTMPLGARPLPTEFDVILIGERLERLPFSPPVFAPVGLDKGSALISVACDGPVELASLGGFSVGAYIDSLNEIPEVAVSINGRGASAATRAAIDGQFTLLSLGAALAPGVGVATLVHPDIAWVDTLAGPAMASHRYPAGRLEATLTCAGHLCWQALGALVEFQDEASLRAALRS